VVANDRESGSSGGGGGGWHEESGATDFVSRFKEIDETRCYPKTMARADEVCPARLWVIIADVTF